ncbi:hypothetical protein B0H16DRAFT_85346 [Mycena metata]|uniref:RNase III domain-containing protein n=1 Tax=Mycena metata TaxID=1033252 RepID=A0AAD7JZK4_9AGAR|nr:hypothetical protein B0H16DRAFT_85346 [Mycena metata]
MASYSCFSSVQAHLVSVIDCTTFDVKLPAISEESWELVSDATNSESRRREWLGDSAMAGRLSLRVYEMFPEGEVEFYNLIRSYVLSNVTFTHLMQKIGTEVSMTFPQGKPSADVFEMVVGAFYTEKLYEGCEHEFHEWFDDTFEPLIMAADAAFRGYKRWEATIPCAPIVPGTVPAPPKVPCKKKKKKQAKKAKRHEKALQALESYRHMRSIEEKRKAEIVRFTVAYVPPPLLPLPQPVPAPAPTRYDDLYFSQPPFRLRDWDFEPLPKLSTPRPFSLSPAQDDEWEFEPLPKLRTPRSFGLSPSPQPAQDDEWYIRPLPASLTRPTFSLS